MATKAKWQYQSIRVAMPGGAFGEVQKSLWEKGGRPKESDAPHEWRRESQRSRALLLVLLLLFLRLPAPSSIFTLVASYQMAAAQLTFLTFLYTLSAVPIVVVVVVGSDWSVYYIYYMLLLLLLLLNFVRVDRCFDFLLCGRSLVSLCFCFKYIIQYNNKNNNSKKGGQNGSKKRKSPLWKTF